MATIITHLDASPGFYETDWTLNFTATDVSTATDIKAAAVNSQHGIRSITITTLSGGTKWVKVLDGANPLIGPTVLASGVPLSLTFESPIYCTKDNALKIQTQSAIGVHCIVRGVTGTYPVHASDPSPADEATEVGTSTVLSWTVDETVTTNDVYFGTSNPPAFIGNQIGTTYSPNLVAATTYYWRIDTKDDGSITEGDVWSFST